MNLSVYLISLAAISCYAVLSPIAKKILFSMPPFALISIAMAFLATYSCIASRIFEKEFSYLNITPATWGGIVLFSAINFIGFSLYLYAISRIPVAHYQLIGLMTPIVGGLLAYFLLDEPFKPQYIAGLVLIAGGLFVALRDWS